MKCFCSLLVALLLLVQKPAAAQAATDTIPGQQQFVRLLAASLCTEI